MFTIIVRSLILYFLIMIVFRIMGKRQIGQMQPFELVLTLIIADLATIPMSETTLPLLHGIIPLLTLMVIHFVITIICNKSNKLNKLLNGKPVIVLNSDGLDYGALKSLNISVDDVLEGIRGCGYFSFDEVEYAIVETTGQINVMPKSTVSPATCADLKIDRPAKTLPITLVSEGQLMIENLSISHLTEKDVNTIIKQANLKKISDILICTIDVLGRVYIQGKNSRFQVFKSDIFPEVEHEKG